MTNSTAHENSLIRRLASQVRDALGIKRMSRRDRRSQRNRTIVLESLENRTVFAAGFWFPGVAAPPINYAAITTKLNVPTIKAEFSKTFTDVGKELDRAVKFAKESAKPPKIGKETIGLLTSNPSLSQWQPLNPDQRFRQEATYTAYSVIQEQLPRKNSMSEEAFVQTVLEMTHNRFAKQADNSLTLWERYAYIKKSNPISISRGDAEQNATMDRYLAQRFGSYDDEIRLIAIDSYRSPNVDVTGKLIVRPSTDQATSVGEKFQIAATYATDRAILDLKAVQSGLTTGEFVVGAVSMARVRFMNEVSSFLSRPEANAYLSKMKGGETELRSYYSKRFDGDHLEMAVNKATQAAADLGLPENNPSSTAAATTAASGTKPATPLLTVTQRFEQEAKIAGESAIRSVESESLKMSQKEFVESVVQVARRRFQSEAHKMLTQQERIQYERAIRSSTPQAMAQYLSSRFDKAHIEAVRTLAIQAWNAKNR